MATSRTGTAKYLRNRRAVLREARRNGLAHCPGYTDDHGVYHACGVELDYRTRTEFERDEPDKIGWDRPNAAEVDHIIPFTRGGTDDLDNLTVLCRRQNAEKGNGERVPITVPDTNDFPLLRSW